MLNSKTKLKTKILEYYKTTNEQKISRTSKTHESNVPRGGKIVLWTGTEQKKKSWNTSRRCGTQQKCYNILKGKVLYWVQNSQGGVSESVGTYMHHDYSNGSRGLSISQRYCLGAGSGRWGGHARKKKLPNSAHEVAIQWFFDTHTQTPTKCFFLLFFLLDCDHMFSVSIICIREWFFRHPLGWVVFPGLPLP